MAPIVPIAVDLLVAVCLLLAVLVAQPSWRPARLLPAFPLVCVALLVAYVLGTDTYRGNGITRWEAYRDPHNNLELMFYATVALLTVAAGLMTLALVQQHRGLLRASALGAATVAVLLGIPTIVGFTAN
ncbi:MAG: hypothetical protein ABI948_01220 [Thermoleophilia bacterium]